MSGIVGILHLDDAPGDRATLERMAEFMAFRGPDARATWNSGSVGLGHAMLRTSNDGPIEGQPLCVADAVWIVADCRLDGRADLIAALELPSGPRDAVTDAGLIARAYVKWGRDCVRHLIGDFAFAIWDAGRQELFCARDHLGIKPFYYSHGRARFIFSNTLDCVRQHPSVPDALDESAIGDFLLFDQIQDASATAFATIRRLPAAHTLTVSSRGLAIERYWSLPVDGRIRYRDPRDYPAHFKELVSRAVGDRLRCESAAMLMSGGVDSTAVATTAHRLHLSGAAPDLRGYTFVYDRLMPDEERHYAGLAARAIGMPIEFWPVDDYVLYERCTEPGCRKPEPYHWPLEAAALDLYDHISASSRVVLTGQGGDPLSYFGSLFCTPRFHTLLPAAAAYLLTRRRYLPLGLRTTLRRLVGSRAGSSYPEWLNAEFAAKMDLPGRFEQMSAKPSVVHPTHAVAHQFLSSPHWAGLFERLDPGNTRVPLEFRHPLFDVRLIDYVLSIPLVPWSVDKEMLRTVSEGVQPDEVRLRGKTPLSGDPLQAHLRNGHPVEANASSFESRLGEYVNLDALRLALRETSADRWWIDLRPVSLNLWLQHV